MKDAFVLYINIQILVAKRLGFNNTESELHIEWFSPGVQNEWNRMVCELEGTSDWGSLLLNLYVLP
jgi:hypothetical protein